MFEVLTPRRVAWAATVMVGMLQPKVAENWPLRVLAGE
jgi:hypothetical protein